MCLKTTDSDEDKCRPLKQLAESICPDDWKEKWEEEREYDAEHGTRKFAGISLNDKKKEGGH